MAEYTARRDELAQFIKTLEEKFSEGTASTGSTDVIPTGTYKAVKEALTKYGEWIDGFLQTLPEQSKAPNGTNTTAKSCKEKWESFIDQKQSEGIRMVEDLTRITGTAKIKFELDLIAVQEKLFFLAIREMPLSEFNGRLRQEINELWALARELADKWNFFTGENDQHDKELAHMRQEVLEAFKSCAEEARNLYTKAAGPVHHLSHLAHLIELLKHGHLGEEAVYLALILERAAHVAHKATHAVKERAPSLYARKEKVLEAFGYTQTMVKDFLEKVNPHTLSQAMNEAQSKSKDKCDRYVTDGQQKDLRRLVEKLSATAHEALKEYNEAFEGFYDNQEGRFVGSIKDETLEKVCQEGVVRQFIETARGLDLPGRYGSVSEDLRKMAELEGFDIPDASSLQKDQLKRLLRAQIDPIRVQLKELNFDVFWDEFFTPVVYLKNKAKSNTTYRK